MKTLVIIGAGFSGAATAVQFLRQCPPVGRVVLINRSGTMARGLAYGTNSSLHLLNVPAGNMSALVDEPDDFLRFCQARLSAVAASSFMPRKLYGDYLTTLLEQASHACRNGVVFERRVSEVHRLRPRGSGAVVELENGETLQADQVVLAFGHFAPTDPPGIEPALVLGRYQRDPWAAAARAPLDAGRSVLLVGAGLTALDVALSLVEQGHQGTIHMLSRRGLQPLAHREQRSVQEVPAGLGKRLLEVRPTVRSYMCEIRQQVELGAMEGLDWRDLLAALRPYTPELWARLPEIERRRFLRHVQPYWDVHRHRVAPEAYQRFQEALASGRIKPLAGRIRAVDPTSNGLRVSVQLRGGQQAESIEVEHIVNCTGPSSNLRRVDDPLIVHLLDDGLVQLDPHGLGLCVDERLAVKSAAGEASPWLSYVGPMLKADLWEATAVPELRIHAKSLALRLATQFRNQSQNAG